MANITKVTSNGRTFFNKDLEARENIEQLKEKKQNELQVSLPLELKKDVLKIDLSEYQKKDITDQNLNNKSKELKDLIDSNKNEIDLIKKYFKIILIEKISEDFNILDNLPNISNYEKEIINIKDDITTNKLNIEEFNKIINNNFDELKETCLSAIEKLTNLIESKTKSFNDRLILLEKEIFGKDYLEGISNYENSKSRIDVIETIYNGLYNSLVNASLIKDETDSELINKPLD